MDTKSRTGTVVSKDGNFFLEVDGKQHPIPVGSHINVAQLKELAGQKVELIQSEPKSFVVGLVSASAPSGAKAAVRSVRVLCYFPADPYFLGVVDEGARAGLARQFLEQGVLSQANYEKLGNV